MVEKRVIAVFLVTLLLPLLGFMTKAPKEEGVKKVVIDAGHGGKDPGNLGTGRYKSREKDISLDVALLLGKYINEFLPDVEVVYTRKDDSFPELWKRTTLANQEDADLFISIHCNAFSKPTAKGCESIVLGFNHEEKNLSVAKKENSVIYLEDNYEEKYQGFDPNRPETLIGLGLSQEKYLDRSVNLAKKIQDQFRDRVNRVDRGVKQQPLWVTSRVFMPSVLVELGFLTNPSEEDFLNSKNGKEYMASAIFRAFRDYKREVEADLGEVKPKVNLEEEPLKSKSDSIPLKEEEEVHAHEDTEPNDSISEGVESEDEGEEEVYYTVQLMASSYELSLNSDPRFSKLSGPIDYYKEHGMFKYTYGKAKTKAEALALKGQGKYAGFEDCFLIAFKGNEKISLNEAKRLMR